VKIPIEVNWFIHRIATSQNYHASLIEIQAQWSIDDGLDAHEILDCYERLSEIEYAQIRRNY
jgi:hypothetical protein